MTNPPSDSVQGELHRLWREYRPVAVFAVLLLALTLTLSVLASTVVDPVLIFGGTKCNTASGVQGCFGYPPTGFVLLGLVAGLLLGGVNAAWRKITNEL